MAAALAFSITNRFLNSRAFLFPSVSSNPLVISKISTVSHLSTKDAGHHMKLKHPSRASAEGMLSTLSSSLIRTASVKICTYLLQEFLVS
jgi:hypothetical protein